MAAIRARVSNARNAAGVIVIVAATAAVAAVRKDAPTVAEVQIAVATEAETVAVGVSNAARAVRIAGITVGTLRSAVRNSFPKCSRLGRT